FRGESVVFSPALASVGCKRGQLPRLEISHDISWENSDPSAGQNIPSYFVFSETDLSLGGCEGLQFEQFFDPAVSGFRDLSSALVYLIGAGAATIAGVGPDGNSRDSDSDSDSEAGIGSGRSGEIVVRFLRVQTGYGSGWSGSE